MQLATFVFVVGFLSFAGGYLVSGGLSKQSAQYAYGENISINVRIEDLGMNKHVTLYRGTTPFDALSKCADFKTKYWDSFGASIVTEIGGLEQSWGYRVNGVEPLVAMQEYQLSDGDNLEFIALSW